MSYQIFIRVLSQLSQKNLAQVEVDGYEVLIYKKEKMWKLSTIVFHSDDPIPREVRECVSPLVFCAGKTGALI